MKNRLFFSKSKDFSILPKGKASQLSMKLQHFDQHLIAIFFQAFMRVADALRSTSLPYHSARVKWNHLGAS